MDGSRIVELLWTGGLAATPLALLAALACRSPRLRPATRHALWSAALLSFITPLVVAPLLGDSLRLSLPVSWFAEATTTDLAQAKAARLPQQIASAPGPTPTPTPTPTPAPTPATTPNTSDPCEVQPGSACQPTIEVARASSAPGAVPQLPAAAAYRTEPVACDLPAIDEAPGAGLASTLPDVTWAAPPAARGDLPSGPACVANDEADAGDGTIDVAAVDATGVSPTPSDWLRAWLTSAADVRDAIASLPPVPFEIWALGCALLLAVRLSRSLAMHRFLRRTEPAPQAIVDAATDAAAAIGLRRLPRVRVTDERISPLVTSGFSPALVVPRDLWESLDDSSRRAVLVHEVAHLKRLDHVVSWIEAMIVAVYWWHPVAWWARHRVREEAEACCDAWVTSLLPTSRRAYAEALVLTTSFVGANRCPSVAFGVVSAGVVADRVVSGDVALGAVSGRTRKLARRITMVMTQRTAPRLSILGIAVATALIGLGAFVTPGLACPPEQQAEQAAAARTKAIRAEAKARAMAEKAKARSAATGGGAAAGGGQQEAEGIEFFGEAPALEAMLEKARADEAAAKADYAAARNAYATSRVDRQPARAPRAARLRSTNALGPAIAVAPDGVIDAAPTQSAGGGPVFVVDGVAPVAAGNNAFAVTAVGGEVVARSYRLPEGKLEAFVELMSRQDVPIYISTSDDQVTINATPAQHEVFRAFIQMIHPEGAGPASTLPRQAPIRGRMRSMNPLGGQDIEQARRALDELNAARDQLEAQAEALRGQAEHQTEQAEQLAELMESLNSQAEATDDPGTTSALAQAVASLSARRAALESQARAFERNAQGMETRLAQLERQVAQTEDRLESLSDRLAEIDDQEGEVLFEVGAPDAPEVTDEVFEVDGEAAKPMAPATPSPARRPAPPAPGVPPVPPAPAALPTPPAAPAPPAPAAPPAR